MRQESKELVSIIKLLRKRIDVGANFDKFDTLIAANKFLILEDLNLRWLVSIADTIADHAEQPRSSRAFGISIFVNTLRIAEMVKLSRTGVIDDLASIKFHELYSGITTFGVNGQDTFLNISRRMSFLLSDEDFLADLWRAVLERIHSSDTVLREFRERSRFPERYFPVDPSGIEDNYGQTYEDLYTRC